MNSQATTPDGQDDPAIAELAAGYVPPPPARTASSRYSRWHVDTRREAEEEGWLLTYLDIITLILVMVVVMLAFAGPPGGSPTMSAEATPEQAPNPPAASDLTGAESGPPVAPATEPPPESGTIVPPLPLPIPNTEPPRHPISAGMARLSQDVEVIPQEDAVRFRMDSELMFASGDAALSAAGKAMLDQLVPVINEQPDYRLIVEGHTDSVPIRTERFPSNWELSTARAASVVRHLSERGVAPQRLQATGYADMRPLGAKLNPVDQIRNRRVELVMERPKAAPGTR
ncbi:MAG: OmpA family protein [Gammaproteobacteria bacterium]